MPMLRKLLILLMLFAFCLISNHLLAQKFSYTVKFEGIGDNREYFSPYNTAETILGTRLSLAAGFTSDSVHRMYAGLSNFYEFGSRLLEQPVVPILFYDYAASTFKFTMGAFPRTGSFSFPQAFIADRYGYFKPTIEGIAMQYLKGSGSLGLMVDWVSRQDSVRREQFFTGFHGEKQMGIFVAEAYAYLFHNAHRMKRLPGDFIEDNMGALLTAGVSLSSVAFLDSLTIKSGILSSAFRNRGERSDFDLRHSFYASINIVYRQFGSELIMKYGDTHHFALGDPFYNNTNNYSQLKFYTRFLEAGNVHATFAWTFHLANGDLDQQQQLKLVYYFRQ